MSADIEKIRKKNEFTKEGAAKTNTLSRPLTHTATHTPSLWGAEVLDY